jgi:hypothetical protein
MVACYEVGEPVDLVFNQEKKLWHPVFIASTSSRSVQVVARDKVGGL